MADLRPPTDDEARVLSVSELTAYVKDRLESAFPDVYVMGEVSGLKRAASGHVYLTLKDENAVLRAVIWRGTASRLRFDLKDGLQVLARGGIDVYPPRGSYQLVVRWMEPQGLGDLQVAYRQLLEKLEKEGLFRPEHKKPLPPFPRRIGIVTSPTGAAVRDIVNVVSRRFPPVRLYLYPARVQGAEAAAEIVRAIDALNRMQPEMDVIIVGRGGGSLEDLWPFNEEAVARAIYASRVPVISAVGHEIDVSISDFVADVRAATPTEAGEIAVPDRAEVLKALDERKRRMASALGRTVARGRQTLDALAARYAFRHPETTFRERAQRADDALDRIRTHVDHRLDMLRQTVSGAAQRLESLSPLKVLERGYSVTLTADGRIVRSVEDVGIGDTITSRLHGGQIDSQVLSRQDAPVLPGKGPDNGA